MSLPSRIVLGILGGVLLGSNLAGCGVELEPLMPTPVLFTEAGFDPLAHVPEDQRWTPRKIYFATTRERVGNVQRIDYGNTPSKDISLGIAAIAFGPPGTTWDELYGASTAPERPEAMRLTIAGVIEAGRITPGSSIEEAGGPDEAGWLLTHFNESIEKADDKDILIYIHGAKVNFYNACAYTAQLDHFMGRDMTSIAFSWPSRQDIFSYAFGSDVERAYAAGDDLATLLELIAEKTPARRIHILCWSAGGRVFSEALTVLRERNPDASPKDLRARLRIGTAYFAAADVPRTELTERLAGMHDVADRIIITGTEDDIALAKAKDFMGGDVRVGLFEDTLTDEQEEILLSLDRLEIIDVSRGKEDRGFNLTGHRYWFNHPWASSDVILAIRTDLSAPERGLERNNPEGEFVWYLPADYPQRLAEIRETVTEHRRPDGPVN